MFVVGKVYDRQVDIHRKYGGQQRGGISTPASFPFIFVFTGESGSRYGYEDKFADDGIFYYTGEGQVGDMEMVRGNRAILEHGKNNKDIFLFEYIHKGQVRYIGKVSCIGYHAEQKPDRTGAYRRVYIFHLALESEEEHITYNEIAMRKPRRSYSLDKLKEIAVGTYTGNMAPGKIREIVRNRSTAIRMYALKRSQGRCEGCGRDAPFYTREGPYLEVHHLLRLSDGGPDHPSNVIALCPNCHRRVHYSIDAHKYNQKLISMIKP